MSSRAILTSAFCAATSIAMHASANAAPASVRVDFESLAPGVVKSQWPAPDYVPGVEGKALRTDGFSTWLLVPVKLDGRRFLGAGMWVALESYPSDREGPVRDAAPSSFINAATRNAGFDLFIDTYGRWGFRLATTKGPIKLTAPKLFPLYRWTRVGVTVDPATRLVTLFQDGDAIATTRLSDGAVWTPARAPLIVGKSWRDAYILNFRVNALNGAFDNVVVTQDARAAGSVGRDAVTAPASVNKALAVPATRFARDHLRPRFHPLPPANWTNEPHGLVFSGGRYRMFYQRTPNGPFKTQMHWGHMSSDDLVNWTYHRDALRPSLQTDIDGFDMKGIWSGDVITEGGTAFAYYTSVNHGRAFNPGISVATSTHPNLEKWEKRGPIIETRHVQDFRDPYLWKDGGVWHMIIGAAYEGFGGLDYYRCDGDDGPTCWKHQPRFSAVPYSKLDIDSTIWEMPVFEAIGERRVLVVNPIGGRVSKYGEPATRGIYWLGQWTNGQFVPDSTVHKPLDIVPGHLSPTVARTPSGALVGIGIVDERRSPQAQEDAGWAHTFSLPREWFLAQDGRALGQRPLAALEKLRKNPVLNLPRQSFSGALPVGDVGRQAELKARFRPGARAPFGVTLAKSPDGAEFTKILYDPGTREIIVDKTRSTLSKNEEGPRILRGRLDVDAYGEPLDWHIFVDGSVVDVFLGNGAAFSFRTYPTRSDASHVELTAGHSVTLESATLWPLKPATFEYDFDD